MLLGAPGLTTRNKKLLFTSNKGITSSNKKLLVAFNLKRDLWKWLKPRLGRRLAS